MTQNIKKLNMSVSKSILTKAPRFFGSAKSIVAELFQNSYRANAENIWVTWDPETRILEFKDDGCGCQPEDLIVVGGSGWDENSPAVDPAGIGVFSILRPEYCKAVTYLSHDWYMTITPEDLETANVEAIFNTSFISKGMTVRMTLTDRADFARESLIQQARGQYPIHVTWQELPKDAVVLEALPILDIAQWRTYDIPGIGKLTIGQKHSSSGSHKLAIWQHAVMESDALRAALKSAAHKHSRFAEGVFTHIDCVLDVDPASNIRPKLPDRNDLIGDIHLDAAAEVIVKVVSEDLLGTLHPNLWPDRVDCSYASEDGLISVKEAIFIDTHEDAVIRKVVHCVYGLQHTILEHFGYLSVVWDDFANYRYFTIQDDGMAIEFEWESEWHYARNWPIMFVDNECLAMSLCAQGVYAKVNTDKKANILYDHLVTLPGSLVGFATNLSVNDIPVQWLINPNFDPNKREGGPVFITSLSPRELYTKVKEGNPSENIFVSLVVWMLDREGNIYDYADLSEAEYFLDTPRIADDLMQDAIAVGAPKLLKVAQRKAALEKAMSEIKHAVGFMEQAENTLKRGLACIKHRQAVDVKKRDVEKIYQGMKEEIERMSARLDTFGIKKQ